MEMLEAKGHWATLDELLQVITRYRQIIETASRQQLDSHEQDTISEDQKHSSVVAKVHYQKHRSREIASKAHSRKARKAQN